MLIHIDIHDKSIGPKVLFHDLVLDIEEKKKIAIIGRNGIGKTTLFRMIMGEDTDYTGSIILKKGISLVMTQQEHFFSADVTPLGYILAAVPHYETLKEVIDTYPQKMGSDMQMIHTYTEAINTFSEKAYYTIEDRIVSALEGFQLSLDKILSPMKQLSGGEKRFVELVKVMFSEADLALIDEPTNHMDFVGKAAFISWLVAYPRSIILITHDRDVLQEVDEIIEIKDKKAAVFSGNYEAYLRQNSLSAVTSIEQYEQSLRNLDKLHAQIIVAKERKLSAKSNKGRIQAKILEERLTRQYDKIKEQLQKPSIWIDKDSIDLMHDKVVEKYDKYKDKNIRFAKTKKQEYTHALLQVKDMQIGYDHPLFHAISFLLMHGDRVQLKGRNGAGKTSLIKTLLAYIHEQSLPTQLYSGEIKIHPKLVIGMYEQEVSPAYLSMTLGNAIYEIYAKKKLPMNNEQLSKLLADYLFDPYNDKETIVENLSGGQKARLQIISMLAHNPNVLILDEPTNHLDLPSIEELEKALLSYQGGILYVSHDSYFTNMLAGDTVLIGI